MLHAIGKAHIQHFDTGKIYEIDGDFLNFESEETDDRDRGMGIEIEHTAVFYHEELGELIWTIWEYPVGETQKPIHSIGSHKLLEDFKFGIKHETPDDYDYQEEVDNTIDGMVEWFKQNFEDPAESVTYVSSEGGYQWQNGGPCDAREELENKFPDEPEEFIELAVAGIESEGTHEWSPIQDVRDSDTEYMFPERDLEDINDKLSTLIDNAPKPKTAPAFALGDDNRFHITLPPDSQPADSRDVSLKELRETIEALLKSRIWANTHPELTPIVEEYKKVISSDQVSISEVYWSGIKFDNAVQMIKETLSFNAKLEIKTAIDKHGAYIMLDEEGRRLVEASRAYRQSAEQTEVLKTAGEQFAKSITDNPDLFGEDVRDHFSDFSNDIGKGQYPERSNQSNVNRTSNVVLGVLAGFGIDAITTIIQKGIVASIPGKMASTAVTNLSDKVWIFLTNIVPSLKVIANSFIIESPWLIEVVQFLERIISVIG